MIVDRIRLDGRLVVVSGAGGGGIGSETARAMGEAGATVLAVDLRSEPLDELQTGLAADGLKVVPVVADITTDDGLARVGAAIDSLASDGGVHGLVDWHSIGNVLAWDWEPRDIGGVTVAFDAPAPDEKPILAATAAWVAGGWGYVVIGHAFDSGDDFLTAVAALHLTDLTTFATASANAQQIGVPTVTTETGWNGEVLTS